MSEQPDQSRAKISKRSYKPRVGHPATERRVYKLTPAMLARVLRYQHAQGLFSETEAARELLASALKAWEAKNGRGRR